MALDCELRVSKQKNTRMTVKKILWRMPSSLLFLLMSIDLVVATLVASTDDALDHEASAAVLETPSSAFANDSSSNNDASILTKFYEIMIRPYNTFRDSDTHEDQQPFSLSPLWHNLIVTLISVLCYKLCMEYLVSSVHSWHILISTCMVLFGPLYNTQDGWSWRFNILIPSVVLGRLLYKGAIAPDPHDPEVHIFSKNSTTTGMIDHDSHHHHHHHHHGTSNHPSPAAAPSDLLWGPLQRTLVWIYLGLYHFPSISMTPIVMDNLRHDVDDHSTLMTNTTANFSSNHHYNHNNNMIPLYAAACLGDALAPWLGACFGRHVYQIPGQGRAKTMEGSLLGVFLGTTVGYYLYSWIFASMAEIMTMSYDDHGTLVLASSWVVFHPPPLRVALLYGILAAIVEGTTPGSWDNITVPLALHFSRTRIEAYS